MDDELTPERLARIRERWQSDVDLKLDAMLERQKAWSEKYDAFLDVLMKRELRREKLWDAVIDKGFTMLIIGAVVSLATLAWNGALSELKSLLAAAKSGR